MSLIPVVLHRSPSALGLTVPTLIAAFFRFVFSDLRRRRRGSVSTMTGTSVTKTKGKTKPLQLFLPPARRWSPCFERRYTSSFHIQTIHTKAAQKKRDTLTSRHTMFHLHQHWKDTSKPNSTGLASHTTFLLCHSPSTVRAAPWWQQPSNQASCSSWHNTWLRATLARSHPSRKTGLDP